MFRRALDPRMVFDALKVFGAIEVTCDTSAVPAIADLDPFNCHLTWTVTVNTDATRTAVAEALDSFLADHEYVVSAPDDGARIPPADQSAVADGKPPQPSAQAQGLAAARQPTPFTRPSMDCQPWRGLPAAPAAAPSASISIASTS